MENPYWEPWDPEDDSWRERFYSPLIEFDFLREKNIISGVIDEVIQDFRCDDGTTWPAYLDKVFEKSRTLLYGDRYKEGSLSEWEIQKNSEWRSERTKFFANLSSVEELKDLMLKFKQVLGYIIIPFKFLNFSVSENFRLSVQNAMNSQDWEEVESLIIPIALAFLGRTGVYYDAFVILAVLFLSRVYQYWIGLVDRGGGKIYSSGSLEFRSIYVSIVLFQGAYIWIKFRDVAPESNQPPSRGLYRKSRRNELGETVYYGNFEPRFKPLGSRNYISVGGYEQEEDAKACYQILAFWYGGDAQLGKLPMGDGTPYTISTELPMKDGTTYHIPTMIKEQGGLDTEQRKEWGKRAKTEFESYKVTVELFSNPEVHPTGDAIPPDLPECPDAGARVIVPSGSSRLQADDAHPFQLGNQGGDLVPSASPSNSLNVAPGTEGMQHHTFNDTPSGGVGGDAFNFTLPESIARSQPEAATNIAASGTGVSSEQPLEPQRQEGPLQENQANDSAVNMIIGDSSLQRQVQELQRQRKDSQCEAECQQLKIQHLETRCSWLESQRQIHQEQQQSRMQQMENRFLEFQRHQQHLLLQDQQMKSRIQELEGENELLRSGEHARKRRCTSLASRHDSQN